MSDVLDLPDDDLVEVEVGLDRAALEELALRADQEGLAPTSPDRLIAYVIYLGAGYIEGAGVVESAPDPQEAYDRLDRLLGAVAGRIAVLEFHFSESAREFAEEQRAHAAHERGAGAYEALIEKIEAEISTREERIANLEAALAE